MHYSNNVTDVMGLDCIENIVQVPLVLHRFNLFEITGFEN